MARSLSKICIFCLALCFQPGYSQKDKNVFNYDDYKDKKQFEKFSKRRMIIGAWQINQLKEGALVVKLKSNKTLIEELIKNGNASLAEQKRVETFITNRNIMAAFRDSYTFSKLYFIYSSAGDSLLNGVRSGIFLDSSLSINKELVMNENFYLIAEKDFVYNSSIGFVKEDSARYIKENGNPSGEMAEAVLKNKYGHQLKKPFPYVCGYGNKGVIDMAFVKNVPAYYRSNNGAIEYSIDKTQLADMKADKNRDFKKPPAGTVVMMMDKQNAYEIISAKVSRFNDEIMGYYRGNPKPEMDKIDPEIKAFLY
jgi:hypothetical protein